MRLSRCTLAALTLAVPLGLAACGSAGLDATVLCGNVQTADATVYLIDGVLLPM